MSKSDEEKYRLMSLCDIKIEEECQSVPRNHDTEVELEAEVNYSPTITPDVPQPGHGQVLIVPDVVDGGQFKDKLQDLASGSMKEEEEGNDLNAKSFNNVNEATEETRFSKPTHNDLDLPMSEGSDSPSDMLESTGDSFATSREATYVDCQLSPSEVNEDKIQEQFGVTPTADNTASSAFVTEQKLDDPVGKEQHTEAMLGSLATCDEMQNEQVLQDQGLHEKLKRYSCETCGKLFGRRYHLIVHERTHTGAKPFLCSTCGKAFTAATSLALHQRIHTGEKPFSCSFCTKSFAQYIHLTIHERRHTGERPFICSTCGKAFVGPSPLIRHERTHTGEKSCLCLTCGKAFSCSSSLSSHQRIHTGEKPFCCSICGEKFTQSIQLTRHQRVHKEK